MNTTLHISSALILGLTLATSLSAQAASYTPFGTGCPGSAGTPMLTAGVKSLPVLGQTFVSRIANVPLLATGIGITGLSRRRWAGGRLPLDLVVIGMPGCQLYTDIRLTVGLVSLASDVTWNTNIPSDPSFIGQSFYQQAFILDPSVPGLGAVMSNAAEGVIGAASDLMITGGMPTATPSTIPAGASLSMSSAAVRNIGVGAAGASSTGYYLSIDSTITSRDTLLTSVAQAAIAAGASSPIIAPSRITIPVTTTPGSYWIGMLADRQNAVPESNEGNNFVSTPLTVTEALADLVISNGTPTVTPITQAAGGVVNVSSVRVRNNGTVAAGSFTVGYYLSLDSTIRNDDILLSQVSVPGLGVQASTLLPSVDLRIPVGTAASAYWIGPLVDSANAVPELNENNNYAATVMTVTQALPEISFITTPSVTPNPMFQPFPLFPAPFDLGPFRIVNTGLVGTGSFRIGFYFSTDSRITRTDVLLQSILVGNIPPGRSLRIGNRILATPAGLLPGSRRWVGVFLDDRSEVGESNEGNNTTSQSVTIL